MRSPTGGTAFFNKTYFEALNLLDEARRFVVGSERRQVAARTIEESLRIHCEAFRVTTRLTQIMAWLLYRRAVLAGEMSDDQAARDDMCRLGAVDICRDDRWHDHPSLPPRLRDLLERSYRLYVRVARLDELAKRGVRGAR